MEKTTRWQFTAYDHQYQLFSKGCPPGVKEWGWNIEVCPKTQREHYQGYILLQQSQRFSWMRKMFPGVHIEMARNWQALLNYCRKDDTRAPGTVPVVEVSAIPTKFIYLEEVAKAICHSVREHALIDEVIEAVKFQVSLDIESGRKGIEWIGSNPDWKVVWKQFGHSILKRARLSQTDGQTDNEIISTEQYNGLLQQEGSSRVNVGEESQGTGLIVRSP